MDDKEKIDMSMAKVTKEQVEVNINPKEYLIDYTKKELEKINAVDLSKICDEEKKIILEAKANFEKNIEKYSKEKIEAIFVPLQHKDLQIIKCGIHEAIEYATNFNFDENVKIKAIIREEHTFTVFLALRNKNDISKRYYSSLTEIAKEPDSVIEKLYGVYVSNFVLTDEERKN